MAILTKLEKDDFARILENFSIGKYKLHKHISWALGNTVYILKTTRGNFILKIYENSDPKFIDFQIKIMKLMEKERLPSPKIIGTKNGKSLLIFNNHRIVIQEFVEGREPKRFADGLIKDIATKQGKMNNVLRRIKLQEKYTWGINYQFKPLNFDVSKYKDFDIIKENRKIRNDLKQIKRQNLRRSVIHGDFHGVNLLVGKNKLKAIIDWDDAHEDFIVQEVSNFICGTFVNEKGEVNYEKIKLYLRTFEKYLKLNADEKEAIYFFIKHRLQGIISWHIIQLRKHKDMEKSILKSIRENIEKYRNFSKIKVEDFLKLF
jgi:homoserine kinase type II